MRIVTWYYWILGFAWIVYIGQWNAETILNVAWLVRFYREERVARRRARAWNPDPRDEWRMLL